MKTITLLIIGLVLSSITVFQKDTTKAKITVVNEKEQIVVGATVSLFKNKENYNKEIKPVITGKTNDKGFVQFKNLQEKVYYILVRKGDLNNHNGSVKTDTLSAAGKNRYLIMID